MGVYSTLSITRQKALSYIYENLDNLDDESLSNVLDILLGDRLYNSQITLDKEFNDNDIL